MAEFRFESMNTDVQVQLQCEQADEEKFRRLVIRWFRSMESRFSRFRSDSELSSLNRHGGAIQLVSDPMLQVLRLAEEYRLQTDGIFSIFVRKALEQAGYDASFDTLSDKPGQEWTAPDVRQQPHSLRIDPVMKSVRISAGSELDLGGIVKSWTVASISEWLKSRWRIDRGFINAGGDLAAWGGAEAGRPWIIGIDDPYDREGLIGRVSLDAGGTATSSTLKRSWRQSGRVMHHLIDPRTMLPASGSAVQCTVAGPDVVACEIWAKTLCILGPEEGFGLLRSKTGNLEALLIDQAGETHFIGKKQSLGDRWLLEADHHCWL